MRLGLVHVNMGSMSRPDAVVAAHTTTIRLATGIVILPQRNPVVLAKQVATLDVLSGGRVMLGVGAGYLEPEFRAVGANFAERGAVTDEYLDAMRALWDDEHPVRVLVGDFPPEDLATAGRVLTIVTTRANAELADPELS